MVKNAHSQTTCRSQTAREMAGYGAIIAVLSNIERVLSKIDFLKEFTSITKEEMNNARKVIRPNPCEPIIRKDRERKPALVALVKILEVNDKLPAKELREWVALIRT